MARGCAPGKANEASGLTGSAPCLFLKTYRWAGPGGGRGRRSGRRRSHSGPGFRRPPRCPAAGHLQGVPGAWRGFRRAASGPRFRGGLTVVPRKREALGPLGRVGPAQRGETSAPSPVCLSGSSPPGPKAGLRSLKTVADPLLRQSGSLDGGPPSISILAGRFIRVPRLVLCSRAETSAEP